MNSILLFESEQRSELWGLWSGQEHGAVGHVVCPVKPVDGTPTFADWCSRGAPVNEEIREEPGFLDELAGCGRPGSPWNKLQPDWRWLVRSSLKCEQH